jgi:hypothetical protein
MADDFKVEGTKQLTTLARRLKEAGDGQLRRELLAGIRKSGRKILPDIPQSAYRTLPRRGGLADRVARQKFALRTSLSGSSASVRIGATGMKELRDINRGRLRHPLFGNRDHWYQQQIEPGFFDEPIERRAPDVRREIQQVMNDVARKITKGL